MEKKRFNIDFSWDSMGDLSAGFFLFCGAMIVAALIGLVLKLIGVSDVGIIRSLLYAFSQEWLNMLGCAGVLLILGASGYIIDSKRVFGDNKAERILTMIVSIAIPAFLTITSTDEICEMFNGWMREGNSRDLGTWDDLADILQMLGMYILNAVAMIACMQQWRRFVSIFELPRVRLLVAVVSLPVYIVLALAIVWFSFRVFGLLLAVVVIYIILAAMGWIGDAASVSDRADNIVRDGTNLSYCDDVSAIRYIANSPERYGFYNSQVARERLKELE